MSRGHPADDRAARFALVIHHDDDEREYAYDDPQILDAAAAGRLDGTQHA